MSDDMQVGKIEFSPGTVRTRLEALQLHDQSMAELKAEFQRKHDAEMEHMRLRSGDAQIDELEAKIARLDAALKATAAGLRKICEHQDNWQADTALDALYNMACALEAPASVAPSADAVRGSEEASP